MWKSWGGSGAHMGVVRPGCSPGLPIPGCTREGRGELGEGSGSMSPQEAKSLRGGPRMTGPQPSPNPSVHTPFPKDFPSEKSV